MTAYLKNIVNRSLVSQPQVRPRISLFGQRSTNLGPQWLASLESETMAEPDPGEAHPARRSNRPSLIEHKPGDVDPAAELRDERRFSNHEPMKPSRVEQLSQVLPLAQVPVPTRKDPDREKTPQVVSPVEDGNDLPVKTRPLHEIVSPVLSKPSREDSKAPSAQSISVTNVRPAITKRTDEKPPLEAPGPDKTWGEVSGALSSRKGHDTNALEIHPGISPVIHPPRIARLRSEEGMKSGKAGSSAIHITIGRVEVRGVHNPPPQPSKTSLSRTMSLEEYLHRRAGGTRS